MAVPGVDQHLDIGYDAVQDRVVVIYRTTGDRRAYALTRRLVRGLLSGLVTVLMRSSDIVARASTDVRSDVLLFEHMSAMSRRAAPVGDTSSGTPVPNDGKLADEPQLLHQIDLAIQKDQVRLTFVVSDLDRVSVVMSRDNAHQIVSMLYERTLLAQWDLPEFEWLGRRGHIVVPQGISVS